MGRVRMVKPEYWFDEKVLELPDATALFFIALWSASDDKGFFTLNSLALSKMTGRWGSQAVVAMVSALARGGLVRVSKGSGVGLVNGWKHQWIKNPKPSKWNEKEIVWDDPEPNAVGVGLLKEKGKGKGKEKGNPLPDSSVVVRSPDLPGDVKLGASESESKPAWVPDIEAIYALYPKRIGENRKNQGVKRLAQQLRKPEDYDRCLLAVKNYRAHVDSDVADRGEQSRKFVKQFASWCAPDIWTEWVEITPALNISAKKSYGTKPQAGMSRTEPMQTQINSARAEYESKHGPLDMSQEAF